MTAAATKPRHTGSAGWGSHLLADLFASWVVFMVALPLCLGIAQACGLPPEAGIITGVVGGIVVGLLAGSPLQVSGPAAGLIVLVTGFLDDAAAAGYQGTEAVMLLGVAVVLAGGFQIIAGLGRWGQWFRAVSPAVVEGMLAGIGLTILAKQFHVMVDDEPPKRVVDCLVTIPLAVWKAFDPPPEARANHTEAALVGLLAIVILATWKMLAPRRLKLIPAAVVAVAAAVLVNELGRPLLEAWGLRLGPAVDDHGGLGVERVHISDSLLAVLQPIRWPGGDILTLGILWKGALTFALIASAETLLCAVAIDTKHTGPRTNFDRELVAQGVGNMLCGAVAALPLTGVIVRSAANVEAGAKTRLSTILHGLWLLLAVALVPAWLGRIPTAALAAILVYTGWRLLNGPGLYRLWKESRSEALIFVATASAIISTDLLVGVGIGVVLSALKLLIRFSWLRIERVDEPEHRRVHLYLEGAATFLRLPVLAQALEGVPAGQQLHIHLERLQFVDHAVLHLLMAFQKQYERTGGTLYLDWDQLHAHFRGQRSYPQIPTSGNHVPTRPPSAEPVQPSPPSVAPGS
ncbi:MAG: SulP family inorganic anion transporter [Gemmataceae bacterium]|nr:SulP family inorganic anion transporter [Gemmata sp.]MDW8197769.1 SulP family inorganic anion transporter [Gemmataceae bacterium]